MNVIEINQLSHRFGKSEALHQLSLYVPEGSIYAFLGPNGAGKSTTINLLLNTLIPTSGESRIFGVNSTQIGPTELAQIGYVSENQQLPEGFTIKQLINYCRPMYPTWDDSFCSQLVEQFELPLDRRIKNLSRGMKIKAALLVSLAYRPRLLILDEPFSGLDPLMRDEFARGMLELSGQEKWTVFISSHDIEEVERMADWVGILNAGKLYLSESKESLQSRFRQVEFIINEENRRLPGTLPKDWLSVDVAGYCVRFVTGEYLTNKTEGEIYQFFPDAAEIAVSHLPLREIFLTLARTFRLTSRY